MRVLLDTVALLFAVEAPERLGREARAQLESQDSTLELSAVSVAEIAIKASLGKLRFPGHLVQPTVESLRLRVLPFSAEHAIRLFTLPLHHRDPFDRQLISQALSEQIPILTPDRAFRAYRGLHVIW